MARTTRRAKRARSHAIRSALEWAGMVAGLALAMPVVAGLAYLMAQGVMLG